MTVLRAVVAFLAVLVLAVSVAAPPVGAQGDDGPFGDDTTAVGLEGGSQPNVAVTVELSQATFADAGADTVLIGRDDLFADSLSSGVAQADGPLLLVPTDGPVPVAVRDEIERLGASTAIIFGGESAVGPAVAEELDALGLSVQRVSGASRIETATDAATRLAPAATTAILARAGGVEGNPTSGFADTLAAGGWSAATGWPVLLTQTEVLTGSTRDFLVSSSITEVQVMGGTLAISDDVVAELDELGIESVRVAGPDRAATAIEVAKARGVDTAAGVAHVIVVDGFSDEAWAAGFASAARSAALEAPIVLGNVESLPPATEGWLEPGPQAITCALTAAVCDAARIALGFAPSIPVEVPPGSVVYTVSDGVLPLIYAATFDGTVLGLAHPCTDDLRNRPDGSQLVCTEIDFDDSGTSLGVINGAWQPFSVTGLTLGSPTRFAGAAAPNDTWTSFDAYTTAAGADQVRIIRSDSGTSTVGIRGAAGSQTGCACARLASFQASISVPSDPTVRAFLEIANNGDLQVSTLPNRDIDIAPTSRPGSQVLGAAFDPAADGDVAVVDVIGGQGLLRILPLSGAAVEVDGIDASSTPYWGAQGSGIAVLADTADGVSLVVVDPDTGAAEVAVEDAGDADGDRRIAGDASGTFFTWRTATDVRVLDTRSGEVAVIAPPDGHDVVGGPTFRP